MAGVELKTTKAEQKTISVELAKLEIATAGQTEPEDHFSRVGETVDPHGEASRAEDHNGGASGADDSKFIDDFILSS